MITQTEYKSMKEYYDWQRVVEYNREEAYKRAEKIVEGMKEQNVELDVDRIFEELWNDTHQEEYENPIPDNWIPKNVDLQIEGLDNLKV